MQTVNLPLMIYTGCLFQIIIILRIFPLRVRLMNFLFHAGIVLVEVELDGGQTKSVWLSDLDIVPEYLNGGQQEPYVFEIQL